MDIWETSTDIRSGVPMTYIKYILAVLVILALAEVAPEVVNAILILILVGMLLMRFGYFAQLFNLIGTIGK